MFISQKRPHLAKAIVARHQVMLHYLNFRVYKGVLLGLATLLIPRSSLSVKQYHILTVIVNHFEKIL